MAPMVQKRRRGEEEVRKPKKKIRVKKQKHYHSSSEDDSDNEQPVVSDAPAKRAVDSKPKVSDAPIKTAVNGKPKPAPKSILKPTEPIVQEEVETEDETGLNTVFNQYQFDEDPLDNAASDSDPIDPDQDAGIEEEAPGSSEVDDSSASDDDGTPSNTTPDPDRKVKKTNKRHDPEAFATSISHILSTKLTTTKRADPVLSRSKTAADANASLNDTKLEAAARQQLKAEKRQLLDKGRVRDVLGLETADVSTGAAVETEKRLKKVAQRGVVRLFNAVRAAQVRSREGEVQAKEEGVVGLGQRKGRGEEMSKEGFLELISQGGKSAATA